MKSAKLLKNQIVAKLKQQVDELKIVGIQPKLAIVRLGQEPDDLYYEKAIESNAKNIGLKIEKAVFPINITTEKIVRTIKAFNQDPSVGGILVFKPLPSHIEEFRVNESIDPDKDIDATHSVNLAKLFSGDMSGKKPATAISALRLLKEVYPDLTGKNILIINRSLVIGRPLAMMLLNENATVTIAHSKSKDLRALIQKSDILITGMGNPNSINEDMVHKDLVIIDCGTSPDIDGKITGDVDFNNVKYKVKAITPVPGGVGTLTTVSLLESCIDFFN